MSDATDGMQTFSSKEPLENSGKNHRDLQIREACQFIRSQRVLFPEVAIILGSGLGALADSIEHPTFVPYSKIPNFPRASAHGHAGKLVIGFLAGVPVVAMQGRVHCYEGFSPDEVSFPVRCLHHLGAQLLIASNASGGVNPRYRSGDVVAIDQHINFIGQSRPILSIGNRGTDEGTVSVPFRGATPYDTGLIERAHQYARRGGFALHQGTYLATLGPCYETRSEYRFFREIGADVVGMSTVPEVLVASSLGMRVLALSVVTNVAIPDRPTATSHQEVLSWGEIASPKLQAIVEGVLQELAGPAD